METRNIALTLDKAKEWYNSGNEALKETALQAYTKKELTPFNFRNIKTFFNAVEVFRGATPRSIIDTYNNLLKISKASAASFKLNIIRKTLNTGYDISFTEGKIWYPYNPIISKECKYYEDNKKIISFRLNNKVYTLCGGSAITCRDFCFGLGCFNNNIGRNDSDSGFLGCATKEIAEHFGKYFAKEIFEAKYADLINYEWID